MLAFVASFAPTVLALTLLALANGKRPKPQGWALIAVVAVLLGPVAAGAVGFFTWIGLVAMATLALTVYACVRHVDRPGRAIGV